MLCNILTGLKCMSMDCGRSAEPILQVASIVRHFKTFNIRPSPVISRLNCIPFADLIFRTALRSTLALGLDFVLMQDDDSKTPRARVLRSCAPAIVFPFSRCCNTLPRVQCLRPLATVVLSNLISLAWSSSANKNCQLLRVISRENPGCVVLAARRNIVI